MLKILSKVQSKIVCRGLNSSADTVVETLFGTANSIDVDEFRRRAFHPEKPLLLTSESGIETPIKKGITMGLPPATHKWFTRATSETGNKYAILSSKYLNPYFATILPYELTGPSNIPLPDLLQSTNVCSDIEFTDIFHHFDAPLGLIFQSQTPGLYIAQAPFNNLPLQLQYDLPVPRIVAEAGKGDIYDTNIWVGHPPTYTPLHKDPNPNLFVQLAGKKKVRIYEPHVGLEIFRRIRRAIGKFDNYGGTRGAEMMEGSERTELEKAVWGLGTEYSSKSMEVTVKPGDYLFIPKGWWHSVKGLGSGELGEIIASANWWFR